MTKMRPNKVAYTHDSAQIRDVVDDYPTPSGFVQALLDVVALPKDAHIWDPCAGAGHLIRALSDLGYTELEYDDLARNGRDFLTEPPIECDWVVTNPPYRHTEAFVRRALLATRHGVAMLSNTAFLEGVGRAEGLFVESPPDEVWMCARRMRVRPGISSTFSHVWMVWREPGKIGSWPTRFGWVVNSGDLVIPDADNNPGVWG